uniref:Protein kinase domain-containing protein n=1 Tax=Plectus sambesii TaxID=2011161 RepID=A0A914UZP7_9BILA
MGLSIKVLVTALVGISRWQWTNDSKGSADDATRTFTLFIAKSYVSGSLASRAFRPRILSPAPTIMEERHVAALESQKNLLCMEMRAKKVVKRLLSKHIFTDYMANEILASGAVFVFVIFSDVLGSDFLQAIEKPEFYRRNERLLSILKECGPNAYDTFLKALKKSRQFSLIEALQKSAYGGLNIGCQSASSETTSRLSDLSDTADSGIAGLSKSEGSAVPFTLHNVPTSVLERLDIHDHGNQLSGSNQGRWARKKFSLKTLLAQDAANECSIEEWDRLEQLGSGAFGMVFRCIDRTTGREVAGKYAKLILPGGALLPAEEARVRKDIEPVLAEVRTMIRLNHDRVLKCFGYRTTDRDLIIFTEFMANGSVLDAIRHKGGPLDEKLAIKYLRQATEGLVYIHNLPLFSNTSEALLHRDLKCDNLLLDQDDNVKLADFGIATTVQLKNGLTASTFASAEKGIKGTLLHMAPEALQSKRFSRKSDIWSMGCTAVEMLTTMPPHYETTVDWDQNKFLFTAGSGQLEYSGRHLCPNASSLMQTLLDRIFQRAELRPSSQNLLDELLTMDSSD